MNRTAGGNPAISVIIPVYNVEEYLDVCMESVTGQTFPDFEVLLIDDASTDRSAEKMRQWEKKDSRVQFHSLAHGGVSRARNFGIEHARGEYLAFVDPDDWLDPRYLELLYSAAKEEDADFAECDLWRYDNRSGKKIYRACYGRMGIPYTREEHMKYGPTATYKSVSRRSLWIDHAVRLPETSFESPAVYSLILALSERIVNIRKPLYYYRRFRENSLIETAYGDTQGNPHPLLGTDAMAHLLSEFRRLGLYERFSSVLEGVVKYRLSDILAMQYHRRTPEEFRKLEKQMRSFLDDAFPEHRDSVYFTLGGYNLGRILIHMNMLHDPSCRFNFSSLAAIADRKPAKNEEIVIEHRNRYRRQMLEKEIKGSFWSQLEESKPDLLILDLIEERFDLIMTEYGFLTKSDAFDGLDEPVPGRILKRDSTECENLWSRSVDLFFDRLRECRPGIRVVVIKNLLAEKYGIPGELTAYPEAGSIRSTNEMLKRYYSLLEERYPEFLYIDPSGTELYFTDREYDYGVQPSHLNEIINAEIARKTEKEIRS